ncbi:hypothetical protein SKAU_G00340930 [Synaphobranchus kaupii]|uniref:Uncharacterized protein n=1 Tax=Synaphobranchus kaupii TaxID=118154 RepID=A0A9Q1EN13_SYNKA|nr:hypothetical protein SKAU_G00340930 [Synaphobranchus kaupii]
MAAKPRDVLNRVPRSSFCAPEWEAAGVTQARVSSAAAVAVKPFIGIDWSSPSLSGNASMRAVQITLFFIQLPSAGFCMCGWSTCLLPPGLCDPQSQVVLRPEFRRGAPFNNLSCLLQAPPPNAGTCQLSAAAPVCQTARGARQPAVDRGRQRGLLPRRRGADVPGNGGISGPLRRPGPNQRAPSGKAGREAGLFSSAARSLAPSRRESEPKNERGQADLLRRRRSQGLEPSTGTGPFR